MCLSFAAAFSNYSRSKAIFGDFSNNRLRWVALTAKPQEKNTCGIKSALLIF